jgi:uncharacterized protein
MTTRYILSLDGGGIRGSYQAMILDYLKENGCSFDLIVGVSAGALNAILYSQNTCKNMEVFSSEHCKVICNKSILDRMIGRIQPFPVYDSSGKLKIITKYTTTKTFGMLPIPVAVICYDVEARYPRVFKSWEDKEESTIDIAMATSAAPVYYPAHKYKNRWYIDGGIAMNNPASLAHALAVQMFPGDIIKVLALGTGDTPDLDLSKEHLNEWGSIQWLTKGLFNLFVNSPSQCTDEICQILMGANHLRIEDDKIGEIECDDSTNESYNRIMQASKKTIEQEGMKILKFLGITSA